MPHGLQVLGTATLVAIFAAACGCEGPPPRIKPWRRAKEPSAEMVPSKIGKILAEEGDRIRSLAERDDTFTVWLDSDPGSLSPLDEPTEWGQRITRDTVFESLLAYRPGQSAAEPGGFVPRVATSVRPVEAGRVLAVELAPGRTFHDGSKLTSVDVQFSIDLARGRRGGSHALQRALAAVSSVSLSGPTGLRIYLSKEDAWVMRALAEVPIVPAHAYQGRKRPALPIGSGPYKVTRNDKSGLRLERFDAYGGARPAIQHIVFRRDPDAARALSALRGGEIDLIAALIGAHYPAQTKAPGVSADFAPVKLEPAAFRYLAVNTRGGPFGDVRARRALYHVIDRAQLAATRGGLATAASGPIWPGGPGDGPKMAPPPGSKAAAMGLLTGAGWSQKNEGLYTPDGRRVLLTVLVSDREDPARDLVLDQLREFGFALDTRIGSPAVLDNRLRAGQFDLAFVEWRGDPGVDLTPLFGTSGDDNFGGFSDPRVDAALATARTAWHPAERWSAMERLGRLLSQACPIIPLTRPAPQGLISRRVRGAPARGAWLPLRDLSIARPGAKSDG